MRNLLPALKFALALTVVVAASANAQQPFVTDDADTTPKRHFHFEFSNQFDWLQRSSFPNIKQNTADFEIDYGLFDRVEIGFEAPLLVIFNAAGTVPSKYSGIGDANLSVKYNFLRESEHSRRPAMAIAVNLELPTGNPATGLGSGLADFYMNGILQKSVTRHSKLRLNGGILFSGNETTGAIGIEARGTVFTGGASFVRSFSPKVQLGFEIAGAITRKLDLSKAQLQGQIGGNYQVTPKLSFDFGVTGGKYAASPRAGVQVGFSIDF